MGISARMVPRSALVVLLAAALVVGNEVDNLGSENADQDLMESPTTSEDLSAFDASYDKTVSYDSNLADTVLDDDDPDKMMAKWEAEGAQEARTNLGQTKRELEDAADDAALSPAVRAASVKLREAATSAEMMAKHPAQNPAHVAAAAKKTIDKVAPKKP